MGLTITHVHPICFTLPCHHTRLMGVTFVSLQHSYLSLLIRWIIEQFLKHASDIAEWNIKKHLADSCPSWKQHALSPYAVTTAVSGTTHHTHSTSVILSNKYSNHFSSIGWRNRRTAHTLWEQSNDNRNVMIMVLVNTQKIMSVPVRMRHIRCRISQKKTLGAPCNIWEFGLLFFL